MMKAALEEYNKNNGSSNFKQSNTLPPQSYQKPDTTQDETRRRRGATVIGTRELPQHLINNEGTNSSIGGNTATEGTNGDDNYNTIKMRYLRSLKIPIQMPVKEAQVSASAPIPIPIPLNIKDFDSDDSDAEEDDDDDNTILLGTTLQPTSEFLLSSTLDTSSQFMIPTSTNGIGSMLSPSSTKISKPDITDDENSSSSDNSNSNINSNVNSNSTDPQSTDEIVPVRKDSRKHKFIPPHELMNTTNTTTIENMINHSLPGNNKRKVFGQ